MAELLPRIDVAAVASSTSRRVAALDGLRGVAAGVVVLYHLSMFFPAMAAPYFVGARLDPHHDAAWWLRHTPLKLATMGQEAVVVFFVISGFVLAGPALRGRGGWGSFYAARLVRLALPWAAAVAAAAFLVLLVPEHLGPGDSLAVVQSTVTRLSPSVVLSALDPVHGSYTLDTPVWSLRWELAFSALLPLYLVVGRRLRDLWLPGLLIVLATTALGQARLVEPAAYLPAFLVGVTLACSPDRVAALVARVDASRRRELLWTAVLALGLGLLSLGPCFGVLPSEASWTRILLQSSWPLAAGLVVFASFGRAWVRRALESGPAQRLGALSFSLYLVHLPVLMTTWFATRGLPTAPRLALGLLLAVAATVAFERYVERPAHRLSRRVASAFA